MAKNENARTLRRLYTLLALLLLENFKQAIKYNLILAILQRHRVDKDGIRPTGQDFNGWHTVAQRKNEFVAVHACLGGVKGDFGARHWLKGHIRNRAFGMDAADLIEFAAPACNNFLVLREPCRMVTLEIQLHGSQQTDDLFFAHL